MRQSLVFGSLAHDAKGVLTAVYGFTDMILEGSLNCFPRIGLKLGIAAFTNSDHQRKGFYDSQLALGHGNSLALNACANETAPVPGRTAA